MTARSREIIGVGAAALVVAVVGVGTVAQIVAPPNLATDLTLNDRAVPFAFALFAVVGGVLVWKRPEQRFGWVLIGFALMMVLSGSAAAIAYHQETLPLGVGNTAAWVQSWAWVPAIGLLASGLLLFPDGKLPSRKWRLVLALHIVGFAGAAAFAISLWPHRGPALLDVDDQFPGAAAAVFAVVMPVLFVGFVASVASLAVRYRRATRTVKQQIKWVFFAVALLAAALVAAAVADVTGAGGQWLQDILGLGGLMLMPIAIGIAILRYRLYEIDRLVSRTVSYALVTALAVGLFSLVVVVPTSIVGSHDAPPALIAVGTLVAAAAFNPLRRRIQAAVDRRFNRARYDGQMVADGFATRLRDPRDLEVVTADLANTVSAAVHPDRIGLWVRA